MRRAPIHAQSGGLAQALEKIRDAAMPFHKATRGTAHLFFINPLRRRVDDRDGKLADLLASHPPIVRAVFSCFIGWPASRRHWCRRSKRSLDNPELECCVSTMRS